MATTTSTTSSASSGLAGAGIGAVGTIASSVITSAFAKSDAKKQRELIEKLEKLALAQQKELQIRLQDVQGELAKQEIIYKYLAVQKNDEALAKIKSKRYILKLKKIQIHHLLILLKS